MSPRTPRRWKEFLEPLRRWSNRRAFYPIALLFIGLAAYLYAAPWLGYFWDDWEVVFLLKAGDPELLRGYFAFDRPFAWPYQVMYAALGLYPLAWHLVTFLVRWGGVLLLYYAGLELWPAQRRMLQWAGVLMLVYPGFLQQSISAAYNRHFTAFLLFALSIYCMLRAARGGSMAWLPALVGWLASLVHVFTIEYYVGLELARPLLLWLVIRRGTGNSGPTTIKRTIFACSPYLLVLGIYLWWRIVVFPTTIPRTNYAGDFKFLQDFSDSVISGALALATRTVFDLIYATLRVWLGALAESGAWTLLGKVSWFAFGVGASVALVFVFFQGAGDSPARSRQRPPVSFAWAGVCLFVAAAIPVWLTTRQLSTDGRWDDRFALAPMWGASLLVVWMVAFFIRPRLQRFVLAILLAVSVVTQVLVVNRYRLDWSVQRDYYWQLSWRVPALQPDTAIISFEQPSASVPGYDASFAMNMLFGGQPKDGVVPFWFFTNDRFLNFELRPDKAISYRDRNLRFKGNTSNAISVVHQGESRCLQVLDRAYAQQPFYAANQEQLIEISNASRISRQQQVAPDGNVFGPEPSHTWCYYFQKADLARQFADWQEVLRLEREAAAKGLGAGFGPELLPFIEAHARVGDWNQALVISRKAEALVAEMEPLLCATWSRLGSIAGADPRTVQAARGEFVCEGR